MEGEKKVKKNKNDDVELRRRFFDANPVAKESDFQKCLPSLREASRAKF